MSNPFDAAKSELKAMKAEGRYTSSFESTSRMLGSVDKEYGDSIFMNKVDELAKNGKNEMLAEIKRQRKKEALKTTLSTVGSIFGAVASTAISARAISGATKNISTGPKKADYENMTDTQLVSELRTAQSDISKFDAAAMNAKQAYETAKGQKEEAEKAINGENGTQATVDKYNSKQDAHSLKIVDLQADIKTSEGVISGYRQDIKNLQEYTTDENGAKVKNPEYDTKKAELERKIKEEQDKIDDIKNKTIPAEEAAYKQERADAINANNAQKDALSKAEDEMNRQLKLQRANEQQASDARKKETLIETEQTERTDKKKDKDKK